MSETMNTTLPAGDLDRENDEFRKVLWTDDQTRRVFMAIPEGGGEVHEGHDRPLYFVAGSGTARILETACLVSDCDVSNVSSGTFHDFRNTGSGMLKLFTSYNPPEHAPGAKRAAKSEAEA